MTNATCDFNELVFFATIKKKPKLYLGATSLLSFRDQLFGMSYAFSFCYKESPFQYFHSFIEWYHKEIIKDINGYACWWNHILYTSGNDDEYAFESFFIEFERYLRDVHNVCLPEVT